MAFTVTDVCPLFCCHNGIIHSVFSFTRLTLSIYCKKMLYMCLIHLPLMSLVSHRVFTRGTMQSKWITHWHRSLDYIGLANHLVLKWLVSKYSLIHENLLLIMQISNDLNSWPDLYLESPLHGKRGDAGSSPRVSSPLRVSPSREWYLLQGRVNLMKVDRGYQIGSCPLILVMLNVENTTPT